MVLRSPCQRVGGSSSVGNTSQPSSSVTRIISGVPEPPLSIALAHKARSTENITGHSGSSATGNAGTVVRPAGRAQSISSDNITVRMAALSASGNKSGGNSEAKGPETGSLTFFIN